MLSEAVSLWSEARGSKGIRGMTLVDWMAWVNLIALSRGRVDGTVPKEEINEVGSIMNGIMTGTCMPWSESIPGALPLADAVDKELPAVKASILAAFLISHSAERVGGHTAQVAYIRKTGHPSTIRIELPMYLKAHMQIGGTNNLWIHPATNDRVSGGVLFPTVLRPVFNKWSRITGENFAFRDAAVMRRMVRLETEERGQEDLRLIPQRDGYVWTAKQGGQRLQVLSIPMNFSYEPCGGIGWAMSFLTDPQTKSAGGIPVSPNMCRTVALPLSSGYNIFRIGEMKEDASATIGGTSRSANAPTVVIPAVPESALGPKVPQTQTGGDPKLPPSSPTNEGKV